MTWAQRIRATGLSLPQFAEQVGIPYRTMHNYVRGNAEPLASTYLRIVQHLQELEAHVQAD